MFVEPDYRSSAEYRGFWEKLGRGEYDAGQYRRIARGGRELWLQASYNPILDGAGNARDNAGEATENAAEGATNATGNALAEAGNEVKGN